MSGLRIKISRGVGSGPTELAAFDAALQDAGVADFNLVRLSSVIPPGSRVETVEAAGQLGGGHGDLLYCVYADAYAVTPGDQAWAGVSWALRAGDDGGLFVEHAAGSAAVLEHHLRSTLDDLAQRRPDDYAPAGSLTAQAVCTDQPSCAVVVATYAVRGWS